LVRARGSSISGFGYGIEEEIEMNGYFIAILVIEILGLGIHLAKHGEPRDGQYNFGLCLIMTAINMFLIVMAIKKGF